MIKKSEQGTIPAGLGNSKTNHECVVAIVGFHNGLVTTLWSLALLIALAVTVRFLPVFTLGCVLTLLYRNMERKSYPSNSPSGDLIALQVTICSSTPWGVWISLCASR